jgi:hypothetical protein
MRGFTERVIGFYFDIAKSTTTNRIQRARLFFFGEGELTSLLHNNTAQTFDGSCVNNSRMSRAAI